MTVALSVEEVIEAHRQGGEYIEIEGLRIFYRRGGPEKGIPLVLTHGIPRSSFLYRGMIPILAEHHPVIAWDLYGFGLSDKPQDRKRYRFPEFERFLGKFIDALGIERAHLVCHDVGGPFTIGYAVHNPQRVATLTVLDTTIFLRDFRIPGPVLLSILTPLAVQRVLPTGGPLSGIMLRYMQWKALYDPEALSGPEGEAWIELISREDGMVTLARTLKSYRVVLPYLLHLQQELRRFDPPTLVLWGKHDPFCTLPTAARFMQRIPDSELQVISDAAHFIQEDAPGETSERILDFIQRRHQ
jgi:pimeloyl-ACP methyl ester carboxylesterase